MQLSDFSKPCCSHRCDLGGTCCVCTVRMLSIQTVHGLRAWCQKQHCEMPSPDGQWRFYCSTCARSLCTGSAGSCSDLQTSFALPFGGTLVHDATFRATTELVKLTSTSLAALSASSAADVKGAGSLHGGDSSETSSWVI